MPADLPNTTEAWARRVFSINNEAEADRIALDLFRFQFEAVPVYGDFCRHLRRTPQTVAGPEDIPHLPISFFKTHSLLAGGREAPLLFRSSGTTGAATSVHRVAEPSLYEESYLRGFRAAYGNPEGWCILGLLPSYLERGDSSLVHMVEGLIRRSGHADSGFYLHNFSELASRLEALEREGQKTLLIGVTYALLDFAESHGMPLRHTVVMETGGMKGRKREITRIEVAEVLGAAFSLDRIHSEYGMTELLSQAYSPGGGRFFPPPWMRVRACDATDPLTFLPRDGRAGALHITDLANVYSLAFIATEDAGRVWEDGSFEVLGRLDAADARGCSLLYTGQGG